MGKEGSRYKIKDVSSHAESKIVMIDEMWHFINGKEESMALESH
jgi:hypothetical protein